MCGLYAFVSPLRDAIHALKYDRLRGLAQPLAQLMLPQIERFDLLPDNVALAWVPLHSHRQRERGFNQAELLTRYLSKGLGLPLAGGLRRNRATPSQVGMEAEARKMNVRGAFEWAAAQPPPERVAIIDDVLTTGATFAACAAALAAAGACEIYGLALAEAGAPLVGLAANGSPERAKR
ncbi:MAG: hypothetical protein KatS3mg057_1586 [Herpetosiphonaceae bacterium]|nr:MAG: hypothetical protein KatS3mg057_1586 [Herpetosiphonaceae bacterium]